MLPCVDMLALHLNIGDTNTGFGVGIEERRSKSNEPTKDEENCSEESKDGLKPLRC